MVRTRHTFRLLTGAAIVVIGLARSSTADESADYLRDVKPVLHERCYACHGALRQESDLRLDTGELIRQGADGSDVVVPRDPDSSELLLRVTADDDSLRMPPEGEPLTLDQIAAIRRWIAGGATSPENEQPEDDPGAHWAFQPPVRPLIPNVDDGSDSETGNRQHPIDAFIDEQLREHNIVAVPSASKDVLLRRVSLDLIGLPPTGDELHAFLADDSPDAWATVIGRLLNDRRHGERWARHWMDVWRYADWHGRRHVPDVWNSAPQIWRWRDWIVQSLNNDHGYDRMASEMLAADEVCPGDDATAATGYLIRNWYALNPNDWMRNTVEHTGKAFLGLTFHCAHCHDHKYDPISQDDYFRLRAFFEPIDIRQDRVSGEADPGPFEEYQYGVLRKIQRHGTVQVFDKKPDAPTWFYTGGDERNRSEERGSIVPGVPDLLDEFLPPIETIDLPLEAWYPGMRPEIQETMRADIQATIEKARQSQQDPAQAAPVADAQLAAAISEQKSLEARITAEDARYRSASDVDASPLVREAGRLVLETALLKAQAELLTQEHALAAAEAKPTDDTARQKEIDTATVALEAARAAVTTAQAALDDPSKTEVYAPLSRQYPRTSTGRRRALASWITDRANPLTARVAVNHIWLRHFHKPLVETVENFGRSGADPTHPKLLDWLAVELMESNWSMKHIHRLIVTSQAYRRSSRAPAETVADDVDNTLLWRMNTGRMEAEVLRDSALALAGTLDLTMGGQELENEQSFTTTRRSLYYSTHPEQGGRSPLGELFDGPNAQACYRRTRSIIPQQALALTNSEFMHDISQKIAERLTAETGSDENDAHQDSETGDFIVAAFEHVLSRRPTEAELSVCQRYVERASKSKEDGSAPSTENVQASLVRILLSHNDFLTIR